MTTLPKVVAFATGPTKFRKAAEELDRDCHVLGLRRSIETDPDIEAHLAAKPDWWDYRKWVCRYIPTFLRRKLGEVPPGDSILYLHVDFRIRGELPREAFEGLNVGLQERWSWVPDATLRCLAAPIYLERGGPAFRFLGVWESMCRNLYDGNFEHDLLWRTFQLFREKDDTCNADWFRRRVAGLRHDADAPVTGHKGKNE